MSPKSSSQPRVRGLKGILDLGPERVVMASQILSRVRNAKLRRATSLVVRAIKGCEEELVFGAKLRPAGKAWTQAREFNAQTSSAENLTFVTLT